MAFTRILHRSSADVLMNEVWGPALPCTCPAMPPDLLLASVVAVKRSSEGQKAELHPCCMPVHASTLCMHRPGRPCLLSIEPADHLPAREGGPTPGPGSLQRDMLLHSVTLMG